MKQIIKYKLVILSVLLFGIAFFFKSTNINSVKNQVESSLHYKEELAKEILAHNNEDSILWSNKILFEQLDKEGIFLFVYQKNRLKYWSSNQVPISRDYYKFNFYDPVIIIGNGYYRSLIKKKHDGKTVVVLIHIKNEYSFDNEYLQSEFNNSFNIDPRYTISTSPTKDYEDIVSSDSEYLFSIKSGVSIEANQLFLIFYFLSWLTLLIFYIQYGIKLISLNKKYLAFFYTILLVIIRLIIITSPLNTLFIGFELFSPLIYASSSLFPSLGDFILNIATIIAIVLVWVNQNISGKKALIAPFPIFILSGLFYNLATSIIQDSNFSLDLNNVVNFNIYSIIGIFLLAILFVIQYSIIYFLYNICNKWTIKKYVFVLVPSIIFSSIFLKYQFGNYGFESIGLSLLMYIFLSIAKPIYLYRFRFISLVVLIALLSGFTLFLLNTKTSDKEKINRQKIVKELSENNDFIVEYLFKSVVKSIKSDLLVKSLLSDSLCATDETTNFIRENYFTGYWNKFDVVVDILDTVQIFGKSGSIHQGTGQEISYTSIIQFPKQNILLKISKKQFQDHGFGELFLKSESKNYLDKGYSFAKYYNKKLVYEKGVFDYNKHAFYNLIKKTDQSEINVDKYNHLIHTNNEGTIIVISTKNKNWSDYLSSFSYLFLLYLFIGVLLLLSFISVRKLSFRNKIQLVILAVLLISFTIVASATIYNTIYRYQLNLEEDLKDKAQSVKKELESRFQFTDRLYDDINFSSNFLLVRLPELFGLDINIYDKDGFLITSSKDQLFKQDIVGRMMHPKAFQVFNTINANQYLHTENIGKLNFLAGYLPFYNSKKQLLGYVNIPYFSNQYRLKAEMVDFVTQLINLYLILIVVTIGVVIVVSKEITKPLAVIKERMRNLQLGNSSNNIEWKSTDEIGDLINEYNKMTKQLELSAKKLADSERESAWRDMAKQVAHEIKNPLTPMKLNMQQMERLWKSESPLLKEKFGDFSKSMIEQIDSLSSIASEFSTFASMPTANPKSLNISEIIESTIQLFKQQNIEIQFENIAKTEILIYADKDQIIRVLNNLIKNAIQSIPHDRRGKITIVLNGRENLAFIKLSDNGMGIDDDIKERIFVPNFTTKSTGMGLGLAMVKRIIVNAGGKIWFESKLTIGTTFYIELPLINDELLVNSN